MNGIQAIIMGIVEGLTEFLPISSTFHLIFTARILSLESGEFLKMFEVVIQSGAIAALAVIYTQTLLKDRRLFSLVITSFIPTALIGFALHKIIKNVFFESTGLMLGVFIGVGILFLVVEKYIQKKQYCLEKTCESMTYGQALLIGLTQACAIIPGVSRAGAVLLPMIILGYKRNEAAKYTFLLSLPTIFAASALDLYQGRQLLMGGGSDWLLLCLGFVVAMVIAYLVVKWLLQYLATHSLALFGWYRLAVGTLLLFFFKG